jgi:uncharacterized repeat protein (TIGR03803 family)
MAQVLRIGRYSALALAVLLSLAAEPAPAQVNSVLYSFTGGFDGGNPIPSLVQDAAGNSYGITPIGGMAGFGTVFKVDPSGVETVLYSFPSNDIGVLVGGLVLDEVGNLYGTVSGPLFGTGECGYVFRVDPTGRETTLYAFSGGVDGCQPYNLIRDPNGNLYGLTSLGGDPNCGNTTPAGCGTIFEVDTTGHETTLYTFPGNENLHGVGLFRDSKGIFYGTSYGAGLGGGASGFGSVYKLDTTGAVTTLYSFTNGADGAHPIAGVVEDNNGNLYGVTGYGGDGGGYGTVFKLDTTGRLTVLYSFPKVYGSGPLYSGLSLDTVGNLYGNSVTPVGGAVFELDPTGRETVLLNFTGVYPYGSLLLNAAGNLYGVTPEVCCDKLGDPTGWGTIIEISPDFSLSASPLMPSTLRPGSSSSAAVTIAALLPFSQSVSLSCSVQPSPALAPKCSISPTSATPGTPITLNVSTAGAVAHTMPSSSGSGLFYALSLPLLGAVAGVGSRRKRVLSEVGVVCVIVAGLIFAVACGGGVSGSGGNGNGGTPTGTYTITVTGSSGSLQHSTSATLNVQ